MTHWRSTKASRTQQRLSELILEVTNCQFECVATDSDRILNRRSDLYQRQKQAAIEYLPQCGLDDEEKILYLQVVADRLREIESQPYSIDRNCFGSVYDEAHERHGDDKRRYRMMVRTGDAYLWKDAAFDDVLNIWDRNCLR